MAKENRRNRKVTKIQSSYVYEQDQKLAKKQHEKKRLFRRLTAFAALFVLLLGTLLFYHLNQRALLNEKQEEYNRMVSELNQYEKSNDDLKHEIELLSDIDYLLKIARKDYFLSKDGEIIFKLPDDEPSY
ncbi:FtsB family cell division protein [Bacillaceae bacterium W0354]